MSDKSKISSSTSGSSTNDTSGGDKTSMKTPEWRSATVVKTFLRFAVSSILYHRQILPLECFEKRDFCGLKRLPFIDCVDDEGNITNSEGYKVSQWLEKGIFKGIDKKFISTITLVILSFKVDTKENPKEVLESFSFHVEYGDQANDPKLLCSSGNLDPKLPLSTQVTTLIRSLVSFVSKDNIPSVLAPKQKSLSIVLEYTEEAPDYYKPEFFSEASTTNPLPGTPPLSNGTVQMIGKRKRHNNAETVKVGTYASKFHTTVAKYQFHGTTKPDMKRRLNFEESNSPPTTTKVNSSHKSIFRSPSPNINSKTWGSKLSFSGRNKNSAISRPSHYPIYSPIPPIRLSIHSSHTPKSSNGRSPCWSEVPTVIVQSITPKRL